jgi:hypothetical protein
MVGSNKESGWESGVSEIAIAGTLKAWVLAWQWEVAIAPRVHVPWQEGSGYGVNGCHGWRPWLMNKWRG